MKTKTLGITLIIIGIIMIAYTGFNYVTTEKAVDLDSMGICKEVDPPVRLTLIIGLVLLVGGIVVTATIKKDNG